MRRNKVSAILFLMVVLAVIGYSAYGMVDQRKYDDYVAVSVIVNDSSNVQWDAFREGLEQGAEDNHVHLNLVSTGTFQNAQEEQIIVKREIDGEADGVIVEPYSSEADTILPTESTKPIVLVETGIETDKLFTSVMTDHRKLGESLADAVIKGGETRVGILSGNQSQLGMRQRLEGAKKRLSEAGVEVSWVLSEKEFHKKIRNMEYFADNQVDAVVSLENNDTEKAVDLLFNDDSISWRIYGEGCSEKLVYYLDKGLIQELIVPNEYYMGYQSIAMAAQNIRYYTDKTDQIEVEFFEVTKENLYDEETSWILFPTVR